MIHIDCSKEILDFRQYDLAEDEVFVIDNLFPWYLVHHVDQFFSWIWLAIWSV